MIGAPEWDGHSIRALERLAAGRVPIDRVVCVFDFDECMWDLARFVQLVPMSTPVIARFEDGTLAAHVEGTDGIAWLDRVAAKGEWPEAPIRDADRRRQNALRWAAQRPGPSRA